MLKDQVVEAQFFVRPCAVLGLLRRALALYEEHRLHLEVKDTQGDQYIDGGRCTCSFDES